jgi:putative chitinase
MIKLTSELITKIFLHQHDEFLQSLRITMEKYEISLTSINVAAFLATVAIESEYLTHMHENLNYDAAGLLKVFPLHFNVSEVVAFAHNPEKIANRIYANRNSNGPESSGDGWKFRGRGLIQLTGKCNYIEFAKSLVSNSNIKTLDDVTKYLETIEGATDVAGWFWTLRKCNNFSNNIEHVTRLINGGLNDIVDRKKVYNRVRGLIP